MDQQAKKHLQEEFDASLEEKDQLISVLQTQAREMFPEQPGRTILIGLYCLDRFHSSY